MRSIVHFFQSTERHVRIDFRRAEMLVTEERLQTSKISYVFHHLRGRCMA